MISLSEHLVIPFSEITTSSKDYIDGLTVVLIYTGVILLQYLLSLARFKVSCGHLDNKYVL